ncbi:ElaA protein [Rhodococcus sp. WAY2]|nr:ElaA protein [Rhodococcus sp. WAY2]
MSEKSTSTALGGISGSPSAMPTLIRLIELPQLVLFQCGPDA